MGDRAEPGGGAILMPFSTVVVALNGSCFVGLPCDRERHSHPQITPNVAIEVTQ